MWLDTLPVLHVLSFRSNNNLNGEIPLSICNLTSPKILDLAKTNMKGAIPQCLGNINELMVLDMRHNNLSGTFQSTFSIGSVLKSFNLHGNKLVEKIPRSLANCHQLQVLDIGDNLLNDTVPMLLGTLPELQVLSLRSNKLHGPIRTSRIMKNLFPKLQIIDLACNAFTAELPANLFQSLEALKGIDQIEEESSNKGDRHYRHSFFFTWIGGHWMDGNYQDSITIVTKGLQLEVVSLILSLYTTIDFSSNRFEGHVPSIMGDLIELRVLNLSHNGLQGHIPPSLGNLHLVESLDLSANHLAGEIPEQLTSLTFLAFLNLSHNHLQGCIPTGCQFATFEMNSYVGNDGLCGFPVSEGCGSSGMPATNNTKPVLDQESNSTFLSEFRKAVLMGYGSGLIIGFSIAYFMLSARNPNWLSRISEELEYRIIMRRRKKQRDHQRNYRRRTNHI
ncbi:receptor-like protein Cf-9 homolog [Lycium barbarum]|uniref:receptor-like protein Cf-9 homolog n=1 Tax=Lycium barbarum TaxID=112863 RepID=UPI00293E2B15|nr:receptor-like protein Cf-9 homolog [Lycium barbarum]